MKVDLALAEFGAAREDIEAFLSDCLRELMSDQETQDLMAKLSNTLAGHSDRMRELMQAPELAMEGVCEQVALGMLTQQPLEVDFLPGILEGLVGGLGLALPGATNPPVSVREGIARHWVTALRDAVKETEPRDPEEDFFNQVSRTVPLDYNMYFWSRRLGDIAPTFLSPLLPKQVSNILLPRGVSLLERPCESQQDQAPNTEGVPHKSRQEPAPNREGVPCKSCQEPASGAEGVMDFHPERASTPEKPRGIPPEQELTQEEPESFIPDEDQESFAVPKKGPHPILQVRIPFS